MKSQYVVCSVEEVDDIFITDARENTNCYPLHRVLLSLDNKRFSYLRTRFTNKNYYWKVKVNVFFVHSPIIFVGKSGFEISESRAKIC